MRKSAAAVGVTGLVAMLGSIAPWAQPQNHPGEAVFAGPVGTERAQVLWLGIALIVLSALAFWTTMRSFMWWAAAVSASIGVVMLRTIPDVRAVVSDSNETTSQLGWSLYVLCICSFAGVAFSCLALAKKPTSSLRV